MKNIFTRTFKTRKFYNTKISRSTCTLLSYSMAMPVSRLNWETSHASASVCSSLLMGTQEACVTHGQLGCDIEKCLSISFKYMYTHVCDFIAMVCRFPPSLRHRSKSKQNSRLRVLDRRGPTLIQNTKLIW